MKKLEFWYKTILPATFEDEVSQYEVLAKLVHKINEIIDFLNNLGLDGEIVADRLKHGRKIQLINEVLGSTIFDGSRDVVINAIISPDFIRELKQEIFDIVYDMIQDNKISDEYIRNLIRQEIQNIDYTDLLNEIENLINEKLSELEPYELPIASYETLGGIKVGSGLGITEDGTLYVLKEGEPLPPPDEPKDYFDISLLKFVYNEEDKTASCEGFKDSYNINVRKDLLIPDEVIKDGEVYRVTNVCNFGFSNAKSITLGNNLETIGVGGYTTFGYMSSYRYNLVIPPSVRLIRNSFEYTPINGTLIIPATVEEIKGSFKVSIRDGVPDISSVKFEGELIHDCGYYGSFGGRPSITSPVTGTWDIKIYNEEEQELYNARYGWYKVVE